MPDDYLAMAVTRRCALALMLVGAGLGAAERGMGFQAPARGAQVPEPVAPLGRDHPLLGRIWDVEAQRFVTAADLAEALAGPPTPRFVLLGEKHDNPDSHLLQAWVLARLVELGTRPAVVLEMLSVDRQESLASSVATHQDAAALGEALSWEASGWPSFEIYQPVFEVALRHGLPVRAGDLSGSHLERLRGGGASSLPQSEQERLQLTQGLPGPLRDSLVDELVRAHCGYLREEQIPTLVDIQRARDAQLAREMEAAAAERGSAVLIAGMGHVRADRGVPYYLGPADDLATSVLTLAFPEVATDGLVPSDYSRDFEGAMPYDYLWFTARLDDDDPCDRFGQK